MTKTISTDEVVTQGDEYLRAKAGELEKDTDSPAPGTKAKAGESALTSKVPETDPATPSTDR